MKIDIKTLAYMYGVSDMYTQLRIMQEDGKTKFAAGTFRHIVETYPDCPLVRWSYAVEDDEAFILLVGKEC